MCGSKRRQQRLLQYEQFRSELPVGYQLRGYCGARKQNRLLRELEVHLAPDYQHSGVVPLQKENRFLSTVRNHHCPMAALLAVSIGVGAEKLGRKISEKRLEHKERKAAEKREAIYGHAESSSANAALQDKTPCSLDEKRDESRREKRGGERRRSMSSEKTLVPEQSPPRYEDVVRNDARRV